MLRELRIGNLALVEDLVLPLGPGLCMLTGETGAGKSLIAGSLDLLAGGKGDRQLIREGEELAYVEGVFDLADRSVDRDFVAELGVRLGSDAILVLRRELKREGRGRVLINGLVSSLALLERLGQRLLSIQSQDQQRKLSHPHFATDFLDRALGHQALLAELKTALENWRQVRDELGKREAEVELARQQLEFWEFQHKELDEAGLDPAEFQDLQEKLNIGRHARSLGEGAAAAREDLVEAQINARGLLARVGTHLEAIADKSPRLAQIQVMVSDAEALAAEAAADLERFLDQLDLDPAHLDAWESRLSLYQELVRKYNVEVGELVELVGQLDRKIERQRGSVADLADLRERSETVREIVLAICLSLAESRLEGAASTAARALQLIRPLGLADLQLEFSVEPRHDPGGPLLIDGAPCRIDGRGCHRVRLLARTNKGEAAGDVSQIASGGERSRIFLGLAVLDRPDQGRPFMLFDEIDAGIGMDHAGDIAQLLSSLAADGQVMCITHAPVLAARGESHLKVEKETAQGRTVVQVRPLNDAERIAEIDRLLGGKDGTRLDSTSRLAYARELLGAQAPLERENSG